MLPQQDVFWLQVAVHHVLPVEKSQADQQLNSKTPAAQLRADKSQVQKHLRQHAAYVVKGRRQHLVQIRLHGQSCERLKQDFASRLGASSSPQGAHLIRPGIEVRSYYS